MKPLSFARGRGMAILGRALDGSLPLTGLPGAAAPRDMGPIVDHDSPEQIETPLAALAGSFLTSNGAFFVRSHFPTPAIQRETWRLSVTGLVREPISLPLETLARERAVEAVHTLECAGNGRALFPRSNPADVQWGPGAVGTARWGGIRLADVLQHVGLEPEARHVWFEAADHSPDAGAPDFVRSIPIEKAMDDVLIALTMNGAPIPDAHGGPLRVVVPGWFGMAWTKWLVGIRVEAAPSDNHYQAKAYHFVYPDHDRAVPVETLRVKSLITSPTADARVPRGVLRVEGFAWAGPEQVRKVEISLDEGASWHAATLTDPSDGMAWQRWSAELDVPGHGRKTVVARATDRTGAAQPLAAQPNASGYGNNSIMRVSFEIVA
jgi:sulfite oxidase